MEPMLTTCYNSEEAVDEIERIANVTESVVGTVNNLMEVEETKLDQSESTASVVISLEQQVSKVQENPENFTDVQDNVGVRAVKLDPDITNGVTFFNLSPFNGSKEEVLAADFETENTRLFNNDTEVQTGNSIASIYVPKAVLELTKKVRQHLMSWRISPQVAITKRPIQQVPRGTPLGLVTWPLGVNETIVEKKCVFWNTKQSSEGEWSDEGCNITEKDDQIVCNCNHLTHFAVLVEIWTTAVPSTQPPSTELPSTVLRTTAVTSETTSGETTAIDETTTDVTTALDSTTRFSTKDISTTVVLSTQPPSTELPSTVLRTTDVIIETTSGKTTAIDETTTIHNSVRLYNPILN
ncbi:putative G-protein coupled receptor [Apostichopus japonicus]|uniref:Putative G-protein coupled receptor n=1 Tax=Stichopus japonicus TaxID=307972 RepID=A0A2G8L7Z6_STIJA|nr:putative G-protein coupled receptor [Apostichopus japonicus]